MARLAVIAVHGVADQKPGETARDTAALLAAGAPNGHPAPAAEVERLVVPIDREIPRPASGALPADVALSGRLTGSFAPRQANIRYETTRYVLRRSPATPLADVDVYELYWADLSRLAPGAWRILSELTQILFHLASLGQSTLQTAVDLAEPEPKPGWTRGALRWASAFALFSFRFLAAPIFYLNLALLMVFLTASAAVVPHEWAAYVAWGALLACFLAGLGLALYSAREPRSGVLLAAGVFLLAVAASLGYLTLARHAGPQGATLVLALLGAAVLCGWIVRAFAQRRPEWLAAGIAILAAAGGMMLWGIIGETFAAPPGRFLAAAVVAGARVTEWIVVAMLACWLCKCVFDLAFGLLAMAVFCARLVWRDERPLRRAVTALKTAALGTMLSTAGFVVLSLAAWGVILFLQNQTVGLLPVPYDPVFARAPWGGNIDALFMFRHMLQATSGFFIPTVAVSLVLLAVLLWAITPSLAAEIAPPEKPDTRPGAARRLGRWLTTNLGMVTVFVGVAYAIFVAGCAAFIAYAFAWLLFGVPVPESDVAVKLGALMAGATVGLVALGRRLEKSLGRVRLALDVLLDVDNYLRDHPRDRNPRSLIYSRLHGLVEFVRMQGYDAVVFVAHSQGTAIVADYLRLRAASGATASSWQYLSFGSPLRQLYAAHFPHWYRWVEEDGDPRELLDSMGLDRWVNLYGAGDYVGRRVFAKNDASDPFAALDATALQVRVRGSPAVDACAGPLAHTHYVDGNAPLVAVALRDLIALAGGAGVTGSSAPRPGAAAR